MAKSSAGNRSALAASATNFSFIAWRADGVMPSFEVMTWMSVSSFSAARKRLVATVIAEVPPRPRRARRPSPPSLQPCPRHLQLQRGDRVTLATYRVVDDDLAHN